MKKYLIIGAVALFTIFTANAARAACTSNQIDVAGDGTNCQGTHFSVTTTNNTSAFGFYMSAAGTFYIDWGDGTVETINRTNNTDYTKYERQYSSAGAYTVRFGGTATGYNADSYLPTITFNDTNVCYDDCEGDWSTNIASVSGSLSALFPMFGTNDGRHPSFFGTFNGCTGLTSIPADLFSGITTGANDMFYSTFSGCTGLTSIPAGLFSGITTGANDMFYYTFSGCTGLTSIPSDLFSKITTSASSMFNGTFYGCTGLTSIPAGLFSGITTGANDMFYSTFNGCTGLTSIPADLFSGITTITTGEWGMFSYTFNGCTNITGYIPKSTFAGLIAAGSPTATNMWLNTFSNTQLSSTCPGDTTTVETTYQGTTSGTQWGNYAMCEAKLPTYIPTSQSYVTTEMAKLQNKFAGSGANKLMTYPTTAGGTPGSRDIVTTLGTPNATTGVYSNTTDTTIPTTGAVKTGVDAKQDTVNGTADYVMTNTGTAGVVGEKAIYGSNTQFTDALVEVGTVNSAIVDAVNSELIRVGLDGQPSSSGVLWKLNTAANLTLLGPAASGGYDMSLLTTPGDYQCYKSLGGTQNTQSSCDSTTYGNLSYGDWAVPFTVNSETVYVTGTSACSSVSGTANTVSPNQSTIDTEYATQHSAAPTSSPAGTGCHCKVTGVDGNDVVSSWVFGGSLDGSAFCASRCARSCALGVLYDADFRGGIFGAVAQ